MLAALLCCVGGGLREEFDRQGWLVSILTNVAHKVRDAAPSSRQSVLRESLDEMKQFFSINSSCRLPLNPTLLVKGINIQVQHQTVYVWMTYIFTSLKMTFVICVVGTLDFPNIHVSREFSYIVEIK
ncbi:phosphatidylinositol 4-phosphate 3-kinase C2 domain-containing subunit beta-like, partial [Cynoglossus semilaevis]|uniref:phosphatidylinositol 4-phosphate 3-kinase C2 domain-containing subunit beta-like n=1 Tax=Cynoglossus semilaevis TaxID=244447 RepID=UPI000D62FE05